MSDTRTAMPWRGPPLALQIMGLLLAGLVVAQGVTLALTLLLPPEPPPQYDLADIATALAGTPDRAGPRGLQRVLQPGPPTTSGPGWLTSERSRHDLARLLERDDADVQLWFYTPLPFAGTARSTPRPDGRAAVDIQGQGSERVARVAEFVLVDFVGGPPGAAPIGAFAPGGPPGGATGPGAPGLPPAGGPGFPGATTGGRPPPPLPPNQLPLPPRAAPPPTDAAPAPTPVAPRFPPVGPCSGSTENGPVRCDAAGRPRPEPNPPSSTEAGPSVRTQSVPSRAEAAAPDGRAPSRSTAIARGTGSPPGPLPAPRLTPPGAIASAPSVATAPLAARSTGAVETSRASPNALAAAPLATASDAERSPGPPAGPRSEARRPAAAASLAAARSIAVAPPRRGLFGLSATPFVEGDFVAAMKVDDGWAVVQPTPAPFPNPWQRRVLLWFAVAAAIVVPLGWLFSRRLVQPIAQFAAAAERLGRDPTAQVLPLDGPAEVGRAAHAFNRMQTRLRSFVDDRTAMIGAISHDLRTPLTRMRFRLEDVADELRPGLLHEVAEMEQMISSVLAFIRDASEPGSREVLDLSTLVDDVVEEAIFVGQDVAVDANQSAAVEVDAIGMRRLLSNLVENAVKYGGSARVRLFAERQDAVAEVSDPGPGLADDELERVFEPFYRTASARASGKQGSGLGLAVCRSIARAHGGDVQLRRSAGGLVAQVRLPLAYRAAA